MLKKFISLKRAPLATSAAFKNQYLFGSSSRFFSNVGFESNVNDVL